MKQSQRVAKNAAFGIVAAGLGGFLNFASILQVAHSLGVSEFGVFSYLLSFATVFQFLADFGLSNILVREMTRQPDKMEELLGSAKGLIWVIFVGCLCLMSLVVFFLPLSHEIAIQSMIMGIAYLTLFHTVSYVAVLRATERMGYNAAGFILNKALLVGLLYLTLKAGWGLPGAVISHLLSNLLLWLFYHAVVTWKFLPGKLRVNLPVWRSLIKESLPVGGGMVMRQSSWQVDIFLLTWLSTPLSVGLFSGPFRILIGITLISAVLSVPLFPMLVRLARESWEEFSKVYSRAIKWFVALSLLPTIWFIMWPEFWLNLFLGRQFATASVSFRILSFGIVPIFVSVLYPFIYSAVDRQSYFMKVMIGACLGRILLGFLLIPHLDYLGSSCAVVICEIAVFVALAYGICRMGIAFDLQNMLIKPIAAGTVSATLLFFIKPANPWTAASGLAASSVVFCLVLVLVGFVSAPEWKSVEEAFSVLRRRYKAQNFPVVVT